MNIESTIANIIEFLQSNRGTGSTSLLRTIKPKGSVYTLVCFDKQKESANFDFSLSDLQRRNHRGLHPRPVVVDNQVILDVLTSASRSLSTLTERERLYSEFVSYMKIFGVNQDKSQIQERIKLLEVSLEK